MIIVYLPWRHRGLNSDLALSASSPYKELPSNSISMASCLLLSRKLFCMVRVADLAASEYCEGSRTEHDNIFLSSRSEYKHIQMTPNSKPSEDIPTSPKSYHPFRWHLYILPNTIYPWRSRGFIALWILHLALMMLLAFKSTISSNPIA